jgi:hypothetical protein
MTHEWTRRRFLAAVPLLWWMVRSGARATPRASDQRPQSLLDRRVASAYFHQSWTQVILRWAEFGTAEARGGVFIAVVNTALRSVGGYPVGRHAVITNLPKPFAARFDAGNWRLQLDRECLSAQSLTEPEAVSLVALIYHEARHAEQHYLTARGFAGQGRTSAEAILKRYVIDKSAAASAAEHPLPRRSRQAHQADEWFKSIAKNAKDPPQTRLLKAQAALDEAQARNDAIHQDPHASEKKRQNAEKRLVDAHAKFEIAKARYNAQATEVDANIARDLIVPIWQEEWHR